MNGNQYNIQRFLALADFYFRITGKSAGTMSGEEMEEFYAYTTQCSSPDELHKLIKHKITGARGCMERTENSNAGAWCMLPPEQRII